MTPNRNGTPEISVTVPSLNAAPCFLLIYCPSFSVYLDVRTTAAVSYRPRSGSWGGEKTMAVLPSGDRHPVPLAAACCKCSATSCELSPGPASAPPHRGSGDGCKTICALTSASLGPSITQAVHPASSGPETRGEGEQRIEQGGGEGWGQGEEGCAEEQ